MSKSQHWLVNCWLVTSSYRFCHVTLYSSCHVIIYCHVSIHCHVINPLPTHNYVLVNTFTFQKLPTHLWPLPRHMFVLVIIIINTYISFINTYYVLVKVKSGVVNMFLQDNHLYPEDTTINSWCWARSCFNWSNFPLPDSI